MKKLNILLTNDDGYGSKGITLLEQLLGKYGTVYVSAPKNVMSGKSCGANFGHFINYEEMSKTALRVDGTPVDCVEVAYNYYSNVNFDLVVSGCNDGLNMSYDTMYSGTVGAALEGLKFGIPSIAVSTDSDFDIVKENFNSIIERIFDKKLLSYKYVLNINFPMGNEVKGVVFASLFYRNDHHYYNKKDNSFLILRDPINDATEGTDVYCATHSLVSVVPLNRSYFNESLFDSLKSKF